MARRTLPPVLCESQLTMSLNGGRPVELHTSEFEVKRDSIPFGARGDSLPGLAEGILRVTPKYGGALTGVDVFAPVRVEIFDEGQLKLQDNFVFSTVMPGGVGRRGYIEFVLDGRETGDA